MDNQTLLTAKLRLYAELEQEQELNKSNAKHYLNIDAFDFALPCVDRLVKIEEEIFQASIDIKALREKIDDEVKEIL